MEENETRMKSNCISTMNGEWEKWKKNELNAAKRLNKFDFVSNVYVHHIHTHTLTSAPNNEMKANGKMLQTQWCWHRVSICE